jgi:hypothetical protein
MWTVWGAATTVKGQHRSARYNMMHVAGLIHHTPEGYSNFTMIAANKVIKNR